MRALLVVLAGACASIATSGLVWAAVSWGGEPYCELAQCGLLRTNADECHVNQAVSAVLDSARPTGGDDERRLMESDYHESAQAWFSRPDAFGQQFERASRLVRKQLDEQGDELRIEILRGDEMPTLVFVEHRSPAMVAIIARKLASGLATQGYRLR